MDTVTHMTILPTDQILYLGWTQHLVRLVIEDDTQLVNLDIAREQLPRLMALLQRAMGEGTDQTPEQAP